ncbi:MAG TPA: D-ribose pyranase [Chloroflexota bacterium]|nr:D-ribose pyranase [Chloroflexota bacterium]
MKKSGLLNSNVSRIVASMGHTDWLVVSDAGFPCPLDVERIDLAVTANVPEFLPVLRTILGDLCIERVILASEIADFSPARLKEIAALVEPLAVELVPHLEFKKLSQRARAVIRTGDFTPYSNVILQSGVPYT